MQHVIIGISSNRQTFGLELMEVTETVSEGLKRELNVVVEAQELDGKLTERLEGMKDRVQIKGFRPGKVPVAHLRRVYGRSVMAEIVQGTISDTTRNALEERNERPAFEPQLKMTEDEKEIEAILAGKSDLAFSLAFEIIPQIEVTDLKKIELEKEVAEVSDEEVQEGLEKLAEGGVTYEAKDGAAELDDQVTIDFLGKIDGEAFEGGSAEDAPVVIGQNAFIPGFEEGLLGLKAGDEKDLKIDFPADYGAADLAGKAAVFEVKVKSVSSPVKPEINEEFATSMGMESLDKLKEAVSDQIGEHHKDATRNKLKRKILDALDDTHSFELPPTLVEQEFESVWNQLKQDMEKNSQTFESENTTEEEEKEKYQKLAERRVRLGLLLSEIGDKNEIKVTDEEVNKAMIDRMRQFPGQEQQILQFYKEHPEAVAQMRVPLYEDKVIDFIAAMAKVTEKVVSVEELHKYPEEE
ncbi:MAG: trigger factor [Methyloligellaceae bacterium]